MAEEVSYTARYLVSRDKWLMSRNDEQCKCDSCYWFDTKGSLLIMDAVGTPQATSVFEKEFSRWKSTCETYAKNHPKPKHHVGNGTPKGIWAGTLTMAPSDPYNEEEMVSAIKKVFSQKTCPVEKYCWYVEFTEAGLPHVHFCYKTSHGGRIHAKVFKRCWPIWDEKTSVGRGHRGGYHKICCDEDAYLEYIKKDDGRHDTNWSSDD